MGSEQPASETDRSAERDEDILYAHSLAEASLYVMVQTCQRCEEGPLRGAADPVVPDGATTRLTMRVRCANCRHESSLRFCVPAPDTLAGGVGGNRLNPTGERSRILDVAQWLTLYRIMQEAAGRARDKREAWELRCDAGDCLDEALRFYEPHSDLPPATAFFAERSRRRLKERPELYIRQAIVAARGRLPTRPSPAAGVAGPVRLRARRWWRFWR